MKENSCQSIEELMDEELNGVTAVDCNENVKS